MLRLKKMELFGFKSFADKTTILFPDGFVAIVGPNGCGKSNIIEAFRWVLGEMSPKTLRLGAMMEVLFSGSQTRKSAPFAEVTITLEGNHGILPIPFDEVAITRKLKDGESTYYINRTPARLKEVSALLSGTGIGKGGFWVFEQGKLDLIVQWTPEERRQLIEESAGISRFLLERKEIDLKCKDSKKNLIFLEEMLKEKEKQTALLEIQREEVVVYRQKEQLFYSLKKAFFEKELKALTLEEQKLLSQEEEGVGKKNDQDDAFQKLNQAKQKLAQEKEVANTLYLKDHEELSSLKRELILMEEESVQLEKQEKELNLQEDRRLEQMKSLQEAFGIAQKDAQQLEIKLKEKREQLQKAEKIYQDKNKDWQEVKNLRLDMESGLKALQQKHLKMLHEGHRLERESEKKEMELHHLKLKEESIQEEERLLLAESAELELQSSSKEEEKKPLLNELEGYKVSFLAVQTKIESLQAVMEEKHEKLKALEKSRLSLETKQRLFLDLNKAMEGQSKGFKSLLKASLDQGGPLFNQLTPLSDIASIKKEWAPFMDMWANTFVVKGKEALFLVDEWAKKHELSDFALLLEENLQPQKKGVFWSKVKETSSLEEAFSKPFEGYVFCHAGQWISPEGMVFYPRSGSQGLFSRKKEIEAWSEDVLKLIEEQKKGQSELDEYKKEKVELETKLRSEDVLSRKTEMKLVEIGYQVQQLKTQLQDKKKRITFLQDELQKLKANKDRDCKALLQFQKERDLTKGHRMAFEEQIQEAEEKQQEMLVKFSQTEKELLEEEKSFRTRRGEVLRMEEALKMTSLQMQEKDKQQKWLEKEKTASSQLMHSSSLRKQTLHESHQKKNEQLKTLLERLPEREKLRLEKEEAWKELLNQEKRLADQKNLVERDFHLRKSRLETIQKEMTVLKESLAPLEDVLSATHIPGALKQKLQELEEELQMRDGLNFAALTAFDEVRKECETLKAQYEDLTGALHAMQKLMEELEKKSEEMFHAAFSQVSYHFSHIFGRLFQGGHGALKLVGEGKIFERGVEVLAEPPGKKMKSLHLLSGGEKCLTALALLFSLFQVKPAPFCLLDEVDAPLDEANVGRYIELVKEMSLKTQLIAVTHQKATMEQADLLVGVSMEERGVSKIVSVNLQEREMATV